MVKNQVEVPTVQISSKAQMPMIGFGTFPMRGSVACKAVAEALSLGYRCVDTAMRYQNEDAVGRAICETSDVDRQQLFVTSKMATDCVGFEMESLKSSLQRLRLGYLDLWLIHWPPGGFAGVSSWQRFIEAKQCGLAKAIGVSNYSLEQIDTLIEQTGVAPDVVQRSWGPLDFDAEYLRAMNDRGIHISAHSPIRNVPMDNLLLHDIASAHHASIPQVIIAWDLYHGVAVVPKSSHPQRMVENLDAATLQLRDNEIQAIDTIGAKLVHADF